MELKVSIQWNTRISGRHWWVHWDQAVEVPAVFAQQTRIIYKFHPIPTTVWDPSQVPGCNQLALHSLSAKITSIPLAPVNQGDKFSTSPVSPTLRLYTYDEAMFGGNKTALQCSLLSTLYIVQYGHTIHGEFVLSPQPGWLLGNTELRFAESGQTWCDGELSIWQNLKSLEYGPLGMSMRGHLDYINWCENTLIKCGWDHSLGKGMES